MPNFHLDNLKLASDSSSVLLQNYRSLIEIQAKPFDGVYTASWLLSDWHSDKWMTTAGEKTRTGVAGEIVGTFNAQWSVLMPDGELLTSHSYSVLLETLKKVSFVYRMGILTGDIPSLNRWGRFNLDLINLCIFLVLNEDRYRPKEFGFKLFDQSGMENLFYLLSKGGWTEALSLGKRAIDAFYVAAIGNSCPADLLTNPAALPSEIVQKICSWLIRIGAYKKDDDNALERAFIAKKINTSVESLTSHKFSAIVRQFEHKLDHPTLLIQSKKTKTECLGHCTPLKSEILNRGFAQSAFQSATNSVLILIQSYRQFSNEIPSPQLLRFDAAKRKAVVNCTPNMHTPLIPIDIGLMYLNEAIRWVEVYGDSLVDFYVKVMRMLSNKMKGSQYKHWGLITYRNFNKFVDEIGKPEALVAAGFNFGSLNTPRNGAWDYKRFQEDPSLQEMMDVLVGAIVVLLGIMKPSRDIEICMLPRDCLLRDSAGRYWIDSALAKRTKAEIRSKTGAKPIPDIVAKGVRQLQRLGDGLCEIFEEKDRYMRERLFYLRNPKNSSVGRSIYGQMFAMNLDKFCDYVKSPVDSHGRRWYIRIHEMRKWFLLLLFWSGRYDVLDAARWMAGHTNIKHIYSYIKREFPADKIGSIEAEWAIDQLANYDSSGTTSDKCEGINVLYERILRRFDAKSLSFIEDRKWKAFVKTLFEEDYHLEPYKIERDGNPSGICVAIRAEKRK